MIPRVVTRRDALLQVAAGLIAESGYAGTSLRDVADAAGIQAGSLYHHFDSKEMLAVELVRGFHAELSGLSDSWAPSGDPVDALHGFAQAVAALADRHRAAVHLCTYDAPSGAGDDLRSLVGTVPPAYGRRWEQLIAGAARRRRIRRSVDVNQLRIVLQDSTIDLGRLVGPRASGPAVASLTHLLLHGLSPACPPDALLDASPATAVARDAIASWAAEESFSPSPRRVVILEAARRVFAARGYEATTVRDIAEAAGLRVSSMYRHFDSKHAMLTAIVGTFSAKLLSAYLGVVRAGPSATETLDALMRLMCSATAAFPDEFAIMRDWWRTVDASDPDPAVADNTARLRLLRRVVQTGVDAEEFFRPAHPRVFPLALRDVMWFPVQTVAPVTGEERFAFLRETVLRGAAYRR